MLDVIADQANEVHAPARRVVHVPIRVAGARVVRALVAAAHRDDNVDRLKHFVAPRFWKLLPNIDANLVHRLNGGPIDGVARSRAPRVHPHPLATETRKPRGRHLRTARVVHAEEEHARGVIVLTRQRAKALASELLCPVPAYPLDGVGKEISYPGVIDAGKFALQRRERIVAHPVKLVGADSRTDGDFTSW